MAPDMTGNAARSRMDAIPPSGTLGVGRLVKARRRQGEDIINLSGGVADPAPDCLAEPVRFPSDWNVLGDPAGEPDLRAAIAAQRSRDHAPAYASDGEIVVTSGAKEGLFGALMALLAPGDEVVLLDPCWVTYAPAVVLAGGTPKMARLRAPDFILEGSELTAAIGPRTRGLILTTPHNPTGRVFSREELRAAADIARAHDLWVICDESFDKFVFDGHEHRSIAELADMRERTVLLCSFSKAYSLPGARLGYVLGPEPICRRVARFNEQVITCASPLSQWIGLQALSRDADWTAWLRRRFEEKRLRTLPMLAAMPGVRARPTQGTFYLFPDVSELAIGSDQLAARLLDRGVAVTPGAAFGEGGEGHIRINLVGPLDLIERGLERIDRALRDL